MPSRLGILTIVLTLGAACSSLPTGTANGRVHEIKVTDSVSSGDLTIQVGDEVRWLNHKPVAVTIAFLGLPTDNVVCRRGFQTWTGRTSRSTRLKPQDSASLCFAHAGVLHYHVVMDGSVPSAQIISPGAIRVVGP